MKTFQYMHNEITRPSNHTAEKLKDMLYTALFLLGLLMIFYPIHSQAQKASQPGSLFQETRVWTGNEDGKVVYHVHGLTVSKGGTLFAFVEARYDRSDEGPHDLVCKTSADLGQTWSSVSTLEKADGSFWSNEGQPGKLECWANPAAISDQRTGKVFIFYVLNDGAYQEKNAQRMTRVFYKTTDDEGKTWSERTEITSLFKVKADGSPNVDSQGSFVRNKDGFECDYLGRAFHMPGPGHGIQLKNGRLLLQFWHRTAIGRFNTEGTFGPVPHTERHYGVSVIFSDNGGDTWIAGGQTGLESSVNESRIVELQNGQLFLNGRIELPKPPNDVPLEGYPLKRRWFAYSKDAGKSWENGHVDRTLPSFTNIDCGFIRHVFPLKNQNKDVLLFSRPEKIDRRKTMVVSMSEDSGKTWPLHKTVYEKDVQYSDLVSLPDGTVGLLYGRSNPAPDEKGRGLRVDEIMFTRFNYAWLVN